MEAGDVAAVAAALPAFGAVDGVLDAPEHADMTPLHFAAWLGHTEVVALLLAGPGADPNAGKRSNGCTPLDAARARGYAECALLLGGAGGQPGPRESS